MATLKYYGIIAVKFSGTTKHHHYISHVFMIKVTDDGYNYPGTLYSRAQAVALLSTTTIYTLEWNYNSANWMLGAEVGTERVEGITYLRTGKDNTKSDNLTNLIDYDYLGRV